MALQQEVEFAGAGAVLLRGRLHLRDADEATAGDPTPGVVMTHGFSAVKEMGLPAYAAAIVATGCAVLVYDHRCLGESDGKPRQQINPWAQMRDMQAALTWLGDRPEVDERRLGLWGSSFSGGEVLVLGAADKRVRAVVANVPFAGLPGTSYDGDTGAVVEAIRGELESGGLAEGDDASVLGPFAVVEEAGNPLAAFLGQPESAEWFLAAGEGTTWRNEVTMVNAFGTVPAFDPGACAAHLRCRTLFVVASEDRVAETAIALDAFARAPEPKRLVVIEGDHFEPYAGDAQAEAAGAAAGWFARHL